MRTISLSGPRLPAQSGVADSLVVLVHGYGADGNDLIGIAPHWQRMLPNTAFVAPNGPERCGMSPVGFQWFPISRLSPEEMWQGVCTAAPVLNAFIDQELKRMSLDESRLALVGFSQGTMMSLHIGLRRAPGPVCIVGYSGALAGAENLADEIRARPPVLLIHGDRDEMIPASAMLAAAQALGEAGVPTQWHLSQGIGHSIDPDGLFMGGRFLVDGFRGAKVGAVEHGPSLGPVPS